MVSCECLTAQSLVPRLEAPEGHPNHPGFIFPSVDSLGRFTLEADVLELYQATFAAVAGNGISVTAGGDFGHTPTLAVCVDPASEVPLEFVTVDGQQCLTARSSGETEWSSPNVVTANGIRVVAGGTNGHNPSFRVVIGPGEPFEFDGQGRLTFTGDLSGFSCSDLNRCSISALADVELDQNRGEGHVLVFDEDGVLVNRPGPDVVGEALAHTLGVTIPAPPTAGAPVTLQWDPGTETFSWV